MSGVTVDSGALALALRRMQATLPSRAEAIPILKNILFRCDGEAGRLLLTATDLDQQLTIAIQADIDCALDATVPGRQFSAFAAALPKKQRVSLFSDGSRLRVQSGRATARLDILPSSDFPLLKPMEEEGAAWGFTFKTVAFIWMKERRIGRDQIDLFTGDVPEPAISMGYWTRKQAELCLLFTRGKPQRRSKGVRQVISAPPREHSRKPDQQYAAIAALLGDAGELRCLEMFARTAWPGWTAWGNQTERFAA